MGLNLQTASSAPRLDASWKCGILESGGRRLAFSVRQAPQMVAGAFQGRQGLLLLFWGGAHGYKVFPGIWNVQILSFCTQCPSFLWGPHGL